MLNLSDFIGGLEIGEGISDEFMTLFPVFGADIKEDFLLLDEAIRMKRFKVKEVSKFGEVPQVLVENGLGKRVLILEGEEIKGAKQNRMVNVTVFLERKSRHIVPVSCVEAGRWSYEEEDFEATNHLAHPRLRARKIESFFDNPPEKRGFYADQKAVWREVGRKLYSLKVPSSTQALYEAFERKKEALEKVKGAFSPQKGQVGVVVGMGSQIVAFDFLASEKNFPKIFGKLLNGYALDALEVGKGVQVSHRKATNFLRKIVQIEDVTLKRSISLGHNFFFKSKNIVGQGLTVNRKILHLSAFTSTGK
jgi:hypothetical protein